MRLLRAGADAVLLELASLEQVLALAAELRRRAPPGLAEIVPAARTILLAGESAVAVATELQDWQIPAVAPAESPEIAVPVRYDGPDLDDVLRLTRLTREELIGLHTGVTVTAAFCGFAPGFAYLSGLPEQLHVPRRATPRTRVDPGAVGLAGEFTGVYPRASPGGWQIIGHTPLAMWDDSREPPNLIAPGARVRFTRA